MSWPHHHHCEFCGIAIGHSPDGVDGLHVRTCVLCTGSGRPRRAGPVCEPYEPCASPRWPRGDSEHGSSVHIAYNPHVPRDRHV